MEKYHMVKPGAHILVGLSGGADSVCLFFLLNKLSDEMGFRVSAVHVNHMLRGESADSDSRFAQEFSESLHCDCHCVKMPVGEIAKKEKLSLEEAGRKVRHKVFFQTAKRIGADFIALAHHQNDQSETMLFHLARGCGISGLRGMMPIRDWELWEEQGGCEVEGKKEAPCSLRIIRPLLCVTREEIEKFLEQQGISYVTDETNSDTLFSRNKIRNRILPIMEKEICKGTVEHMAKTAELLGEAEDFLSEMTREAFERTVSKFPDARSGTYRKFPDARSGTYRTFPDARSGTYYEILIENLAKEHEYLKRSVLKKALEQLANANRDLERIHIEKVLELCQMPVGKKVSLPYQMTAMRTYETIALIRKTEGQGGENGNKKMKPEKGSIEEAMVPIDFQLPKPEEMLTFHLGNGVSLTARVMPYEKFLLEICEGKKGEVPNKLYTKWFDCDKIKRCLTVRFREAGDYFYLNETDRKKLKAFFIHEKVPCEERDSIYVLSEAKHVLWVVGHRISHYYKVNENTSHVLEITIRGGFTDGSESESIDFGR